MPETGGPSAQSGFLYQNTVAVEFLTKLLLNEDNIDCVQIEAPEPIGDIVLFVNQCPTIYMQVKENAPRGIWTASKLNTAGFWLSVKSQLERNPNAQIWFITASTASTLRELADRCRRAIDEETFDTLINKFSYLRKEFIRICESVQLEPNSTKELITHIYIKDSFGSIEAVSQRVKNRIAGPKGEDLFILLRDTVLKGARIRQKFTLSTLSSILKDHGLVAIKRVEKKLFTQSLDDLISLCSKSIKSKIENTIGEKYRPDLFVTRQIQTIIEESVFKSQLDVAQLLAKVQSKIKKSAEELKLNLHYSLSDSRMKNLYGKYLAVNMELQELINHLQNRGKVDWHSIKPEIEKMIADLSHPEGAKLVEEIRKAINNVIVVVDKAGRGKTNILCHMAIEWSKQNLVGLFFGGELILIDRLSLLRKIGESFGFEGSLDPMEWFDDLDSRLQSQEKYMIIIVDAVNESTDAELLKQNLEELAQLTYNSNLRVLLSCRDVYWAGYFHIKHELLDNYTAFITGLGDFTAQEFNEVWPKYCNYFHVTIENLTTEAKIALHHPLLLRFFCEAYGSKFGPTKRLGQITHIRLKKLFDDYWRNKCESIRLKLKHRSIGEIDRFLKSLTWNMFKNMSRYVPLNRIPDITGESDLETEKSKYVAVLDEDVIIEQSIIGQEPVVTFVYDEFMEYMMAHSMITQLTFSNRLKLTQELVSILRKSKKYPSILGVVGYISIILNEDMEISVWEPLVEKYPKWHLTAARSCAQLDEQKWDQSIFSAVRKMTETACTKFHPEEILNIELFNLLERMTTFYPDNSISIWNIWLCMGPKEPRVRASDMLAILATEGHDLALSQLDCALRSGSEEVAGTAAYALGKVLNEYVPRVLATQTSHGSSIIRQAVAYSLGLFSPSIDIRLALLELLKNDDWDVCYTAAVSILQDPHENVFLALNILTDRSALSSDIERRNKSKLVQKIVYLWQQLHPSATGEDFQYLIYNGDSDSDILQVMRTLRQQLSTHLINEKAHLIRNLDYLIEQGDNLVF